MHLTFCYIQKLNYLSIIFIFVVVFSSCQSENNQKVLYVQNQELFAEYKGKKELDIKYDEWKNVWKIKLDSLELTVNQLKNNNDNNEIFQQKAYEFQMTQNEFQQRAQELQSQYFEQVWKQLNSYIKEFGETNDCQLILGANGDGSIMYAVEEIDITKEVISYVNDRYEGK